MIARNNLRLVLRPLQAMLSRAVSGLGSMNILRLFCASVTLSSVSFSSPIDLKIQRNGESIAIEASSDLYRWDTITNLTVGGAQKFFRSSTTNPVPLNFLYEPRAIRAVRFFDTYYGIEGQSEPLVDPYPIQDEHGIRMWRTSDGKIHNHPTLQSEYALAMYNGFLNTTNPAYIAKAEACAQRLIDTKVESRGAWFYPVPFSASIRWPEVIPPPIYGSIGQGNALSLFVLLYQHTQKPIYLEAAQKTFASYKLPPDGLQPFITELDDEGYLWFEEYATDPARAEYVYNGHIFGLFGLYDYYQFTRDPDAARLMEGGFLTVKRWFSWFRTPGWAIKYGRRTPIIILSYQDTLVRQLRVCYSMTGDLFFAQAAEQLADDYPSTKYACPCTLSGGLTGFQFDQYGAITNSLTTVVESPTRVWGNSRRSIINQPGTWLRIQDGVLSNFWVKEFHAQAAMNCVVQPIPFEPPRQLTLQRGDPPYVFNKYAVYGQITNTVSKKFDNDQHLKFDRRAVINARLHVRITGGDFDTYWVPVTPRTILDGGENALISSAFPTGPKPK